MKQQAKNLATADLLYALMTFSECKGKYEAEHNVVPDAYNISLQAIKSAIQLINSGEK